MRTGTAATVRLLNPCSTSTAADWPGSAIRFLIPQILVPCRAPDQVPAGAVPFDPLRQPSILCSADRGCQPRALIRGPNYVPAHRSIGRADRSAKTVQFPCRTRQRRQPGPTARGLDGMNRAAPRQVPVISSASYPPAFIARWRKGTSPHSNRLNAQRCSMAVKANQDQRPKADPRQPIPKLSSGQNNRHPDRVWRSRRKGIRQPSSPDGGKARLRIQTD